MQPTDLNAVARLCLIAQCHGPEFLDDADRFDRVIGAGAFASTDSHVLDEARRRVKSIRRSERKMQPIDHAARRQDLVEWQTKEALDGSLRRISKRVARFLDASSGARGRADWK